MKRFFAILLLTVHLTNFAGYSLVFSYLMYKSDRQIIQQIDKGSYDRSQLTILKVPMHLPYYSSFGEFERVEGEVKIDGVYYSYVERKVSQDTLYLACLPNHAKTDISQAKDKLAGDINQTSNKNSDPGRADIKKLVFGSEYDNFNIEPLSSDSFVLQSPKKLQGTPSLMSAFIPVPFTPPDLA